MDHNAIQAEQSTTTPEQHDEVNAALGFRFLRALAVEKAALDQSLPPACVRILAAISYFMNSQTKRAWPGYDRLAEISGYSTEVIDKSIRLLKKSGYIFTERKAPPAGGRALVHYGLAALHLSDVDQMISAAISKLRQEAEAKPKPTSPRQIQRGEADPAKNTGPIA